MNSRRIRSAGLPLLAVSLAGLLLYLATLYPGVGGRINPGDSAKWQFIGEVFGLPHAPGSPLYVLLNGLWVRLPLGGSVAVRANALSAIAAAAALGALLWVCRRSVGDRSAAGLAVALFAVGPTFWSLATEAEVYTLATALMVTAIGFVLRFRDRGRAADLYVGWLLLVLALTVHTTAILLLPGLAWLALADRRRRSALRPGPTLAVLAILAALGLAPLAYVPIRTLQAPAYSEAVNVHGVSGLLDYVSGGDFKGSMGTLISPASLEGRIRDLGGWFVAQFSVLGALLAVGGAIVHVRRRTSEALGFLLMVSPVTAFALTYDISDVVVYFLPTAVLSTVWIAWGTAALAGDARSRRALGLGVAILAVAVTAWRAAPRVIQDHSDHAWLGRLHEVAPAGSLVAWPLNYDHKMSLFYFHLVEDHPSLGGASGLRPAVLEPIPDIDSPVLRDAVPLWKETVEDLFSAPIYILDPRSLKVAEDLGLPTRRLYVRGGAWRHSLHETPTWSGWAPVSDTPEGPVAAAGRDGEEPTTGTATANASRSSIDHRGVRWIARRDAAGKLWLHRRRGGRELGRSRIPEPTWEDASGSAARSSSRGSTPTVAPRPFLAPRGDELVVTVVDGRGDRLANRLRFPGRPEDLEARIWSPDPATATLVGLRGGAERALDGILPGTGSPPSRDDALWADGSDWSLSFPIPPDLPAAGLVVSAEFEDRYRIGCSDEGRTERFLGTVPYRRERGMQARASLELDLEGCRVLTVVPVPGHAPYVLGEIAVVLDRAAGER